MMEKKSDVRAGETIEVLIPPWVRQSAAGIGPSGHGDTGVKLEIYQNYNGSICVTLKSKVM